MILTLEVVGRQAQELGAGNRKIFKAIGGTIGRLPDNDWVFPDPYVSGRHALIRYLNGKYFIEDTSTNGVFINAPDNRLSRSQPQQLRDGDRLFIDAYEIKVSLAGDAAASGNDPFARLKGTALKADGPKAAAAPPPRPAEPVEDRTANLAIRPSEDDDEDDEPDDEDEGTEWFGMSEVAEPQLPKPSAVLPARSEPERSPTARSRALPEQGAERPIADKPVRSRHASSPEVEPALQALLAAARIEGLQPNAKVAQTLGEVLRITMEGLMEALRTRERMKDDLRMRGTTFKAVDNNPLKFSANVDDAFHNLLVKHNPAYLAPAAAVEDAFRDVRDHQNAFLAAMRLAFESMLAQFDPDRLQDEFDRQLKKGSILGVPAKLRYWDLYRDKYAAAGKDAETAFRMLFADAFTQAYEEQLERLKAAVT